ncbi:MAG: HIT family protein [Methylocystis sp.]
MAACLFCKIARKELGCHLVHEDDLVMAFLDLHPIRPAHTQIIPRVHADYFEDLDGPTASRILEIGQCLARAMKAVYAVPRVAFLFSGGDIAHAHAHVVPMHDATDITSRRYILEERVTFHSTPRMSSEELGAVASQFRQMMKP